MHVYPARVITPARVWSPCTATEDGTPGVVLVDAKDQTRLATVTDADVQMASADKKTLLGTERLWIVTGNVDGEPVRWAVQMARGCGCGGTAETPPNDTDLAVLT